MGGSDTALAAVKVDPRDIAMEYAEGNGDGLELGDMFVVCNHPILSVETKSSCYYELWFGLLDHLVHIVIFLGTGGTTNATYWIFRLHTRKWC
jgi:hypothetical protein